MRLDHGIRGLIIHRSLIGIQEGRSVTIGAIVVTVYAGRAFGRDVIRSIYPDGPNGAYGYVELVRRF